MNVAQLIARLQTMPQEAEILIRDRGGCEDCNPEGMEFLTEIDTIEHRTDIADQFLAFDGRRFGGACPSAVIL